MNGLPLVMAMLKNTKTGRWHWIILKEAPAGEGAAPDGMRRLRPHGHHLNGFEQRPAAVAAARTAAAELLPPGVLPVECLLDEDHAWNGDGPPALNLLCRVEQGRISLIRLH